MPRDINGVYTLPAGNPVVTGTTISSTWGNTTLSDIATALTQSLSVDGSVTTAKIANVSVTTAKIVNANVTSAKLETNIALPGIPSLPGGGIAFPATQVPSADANTLDDYEEGTWTPTMAFATPGTSSITPSVQLGVYTKIGNLVTIQAQFTASILVGTGSGVLIMSGLPFSAAGTQGIGAVHIAGSVVLPASSMPVSRVLTGESTLTVFYSVATTGSTGTVNAGNISSGTVNVIISCSYRV